VRNFWISLAHDRAAGRCSTGCASCWRRAALVSIRSDQAAGAAAALAMALGERFAGQVACCSSCHAGRADHQLALGAGLGSGTGGAGGRGHEADAEWVELAIGVPAILGVYCLVIWRRGFGPEDRMLFRKQTGLILSSPRVRARSVVVHARNGVCFPGAHATEKDGHMAKSKLIARAGRPRHFWPEAPSGCAARQEHAAGKRRRCRDRLPAPAIMLTKTRKSAFRRRPRRPPSRSPRRRLWEEPRRKAAIAGCRRLWCPSDPGNERYDGKEVSPVHLTRASPVSTFSVDVDTGAYANTRRFLSAGPAAAEGTRCAPRR